MKNRHRFIALAIRLEKESERVFKKANRRYNKPETGNSDEDWTRSFKEVGYANGLNEAAGQIRELVYSLERREK